MVQFYGLQGQYFIHLRYNGDRKFDIQNLDTNDVEIQYPPLPNQPPVVLPAAPKVVANEQPPHVPNVQHADVVGWDVIASEAFVTRDNPLYIPAHVVDIMIERRQRWLDLINTAGDCVHATILRKKKRSRNERYVGRGWYEFCRNLNVQVGDIVQFRFYGNPYELHVSYF
ncbi:DNA-binding barrel domain superfamily [Sesbania bispinosa]|nr:DNA-binding barrel domain superfamily [Sesbania bispinosa]